MGVGAVIGMVCLHTMGFAYLLRHNDAHQIDPAISNPQTRLTPLHETEPESQNP